MTTTVFIQDIGIYDNGKRLVGGISPNLYFKNTGTGTLNATLILCVCQNINTPEESSFVTQSWHRKKVEPNEEIFFDGTYLFNEDTIDSIINSLNVGEQKIRLQLDVTGGASEPERNAMVKQTYTDTIDYSVISYSVI